MRLHEELSCHQEGDTGCRGRGQTKGMGDRLTPVSLGSTGSAHLSPVAKGLEPSKTHGSNWWCWGSWRRQGVRWNSVLPLVSLWDMSWGVGDVPLTCHTCTLLGAQASYTSCMIGKFQTESK